MIKRERVEYKKESFGGQRSRELELVENITKEQKNP